MHYANGREAKKGDFVVGRSGDIPVAGVIVALYPGSTSCNVAIVPIQYNGSTSYTVSDFIHLDDVPKKPENTGTPPAS